MPFRTNTSEHPHINYTHMPIAGLYELKRMIEALEGRLDDVACPTLVMQGNNDHVVDPISGDLIFDALGAKDKTLHKIPTERHGILYEDVGGTQDTICSFIGGLPPTRTKQD
ncbi:MAG: hypothetical protein A2516_11715 [Alphaproteobacteria bacterium RIFOXYD12_FULL_60_8]|nr:MAG: hypothetical protein A2516_11715 [Alphaproteobacteria bacterium RIFOXYD12_FULL_60_8]